MADFEATDTHRQKGSLVVGSSKGETRRDVGLGKRKPQELASAPAAGLPPLSQLRPAPLRCSALVAPGPGDGSRAPTAAGRECL